MTGRFRFMRSLLAGCAFCVVQVAHAGSAGADGTCTGQVFYIGTQGSGPGEGVYAARLDETRASLCLVGLAAEVERPTWIEAHPQKPILYVASDDKSSAETRGLILAMRPESDGTRLERFAEADSGGAGATHMTLDTLGTSLFVANFRSGTAAVLPVAEDGAVAAPTASMQNAGSGPKKRQQSPHAHAVGLDAGGQFLFVPDLGADRLFIYRFDAAAHTMAPAAMPFVAMPPGSGPRHVAAHPDGRFVYLLSEFSPVISVFREDAETGALAAIQTVAVMEDDEADILKGAEIDISPDGRFVYVSGRGEDCIVAYAVDAQSGILSEIQRLPSGGQVPWSFSFGPGARWLLVTNQGSDRVNLFRRDIVTGLLTDTGSSITVGKPTSAAFLQAAPGF
ncbi:MAG: lactonase family protein [Alphaproteobacteria bacterium]|nr:MAG: lactonase family protein [Alphaproteobacteria bacterium]